MAGAEADFSIENDMCVRWKRPVVSMVARWKPEGLALFDTDAWRHPEVHPSAAPEVMAGEAALLHLDRPLCGLNTCSASGTIAAMTPAMCLVSGNCLRGPQSCMI